jgi:hypothetical protein
VRPALARLKAVLDRVRLEHPRALLAEARLRRLGQSYLVGSYVVQDETGLALYLWRNPALLPPAAGMRAASA